MEGIGIGQTGETEDRGQQQQVDRGRVRRARSSGGFAGGIAALTGWCSVAFQACLPEGVNRFGDSWPKALPDGRGSEPGISISQELPSRERERARAFPKTVKHLA